MRLFDRDRGGVHLTVSGRAFAERATALLREADDLDWMLDQAAGGRQGDIAFGIAPLPAATLLPRLLPPRLARAPGLRTHVTVRDAEALLALLISEDIEFFICAEGQIGEAAPVKGVALGRFPTSLIVRAHHPLLTRKGPPPGRRFPLIVAAQTRDFGKHADSPVLLDDAPHLVLDDYGALTQITETSDAIWLSSAFAVIDSILIGRLSVLPAGASGRLPDFRMLMYSLARRSLSPGASGFIDICREQIRKLSAQLATVAGD